MIRMLEDQPAAFCQDKSCIITVVQEHHQTQKVSKYTCM